MEFIIFVGATLADAERSRSLTTISIEPGVQFANLSTNMHPLTIKGIMAGRFIRKVCITDAAMGGDNLEVLETCIERARKKNPNLKVVRVS